MPVNPVMAMSPMSNPWTKETRGPLVPGPSFKLQMRLVLLNEPRTVFNRGSETQFGSPIALRIGSGCTRAS